MVNSIKFSSVDQDLSHSHECNIFYGKHNIHHMKCNIQKCNIRHGLQIKTMTQTQTQVLDLLIVNSLFTHWDKVYSLHYNLMNFAKHFERGHCTRNGNQ